MTRYKIPLTLYTCSQWRLLKSVKSLWLLRNEVLRLLFQYRLTVNEWVFFIWQRDIIYRRYWISMRVSNFYVPKTFKSYYLAIHNTCRKFFSSFFNYFWSNGFWHFDFHQNLIPKELLRENKSHHGSIRLNQFWIVKHLPTRLYVTALNLYCFRRRERIIVLTIPEHQRCKLWLSPQTLRDLTSSK